MNGNDCPVPTHAPCPECPDEACLDTAHPTMKQINKTDPDGFPVVDRSTGEIMQVTVPTFSHVNSHSAFNSSGLVAASCDHGVKEPPQALLDDLRALGLSLSAQEAGAPSWIRSKYIGANAKCVVCNGEPRPADLTTARA